MKHYMDIQLLQETGVDERPNDSAFVKGDIIQITEKVDGANASVRYIDGALHAFSRENECSDENDLRGFLGYVKTLPAEKFEPYKDYVIFGEWLVSHVVRYNKDCMNKWYVYDVYDTVNTRWMPQDFVKQLCNNLGLTYVRVLYEGAFASWDDIREIARGESIYGAPMMEGVVVKHITKLNDRSVRTPVYLKVVNLDYIEKVKRTPKPIDPEVQAEQDRAKALMETICTKNRVRKEIYKCVDEGLITQPFTIRTLAPIIPKRVYNDLVKEENATLEEVGELAGKICGTLTMQHINSILREQGENRHMDDCNQ